MQRFKYYLMAVLLQLATMPSVLLAEPSKPEEAPTYENYRAHISSSKEPFGLAKFWPFFYNGKWYLELLGESPTCQKYVELRESQRKRVTQLLHDFGENDDILDPRAGVMIAELLDLSQQAKMASWVIAEEGLAGLRYRFLKDSLFGLTEQQQQTLNSLLKGHGPPISKLQLQLFSPAGASQETIKLAKAKLQRMAEEFDKAVWRDVLNRRQRQLLLKLPPMPDDLTTIGYREYDERMKSRSKQ